MGKPDTGKSIATQDKLTNEQIDLAKKSDARADTLFNESQPGFRSAIDHYTKIASGDSSAIQHEIAPGVSKVTQAAAAQKEHIKENMPRGGASELAQAEVDINKAGQIGEAGLTAYNASFDKLANLAHGGMAISGNEIAAALSAFSGASSSNQASANMAEAAKSAQLGFISSLGGDAAMGAGLAFGA